MSARVTATEVKQVIATKLSTTVIDAYILAANELVTNVIGSSTALTDALKKEIERWLTAHLIAYTQERMGAEEGAGGATITYTGEWGKYLEGTPYGQMVLVLDTTGAFAAVAAGKGAARLFAIPTEYDE